MIFRLGSVFLIAALALGGCGGNKGGGDPDDEGDEGDEGEAGRGGRRGGGAGYVGGSPAGGAGGTGGTGGMGAAGDGPAGGPGGGAGGMSGGDCRMGGACEGFTYCDLGTGACLPGCFDDRQCTGVLEACDASHACGCATGAHRCGSECRRDDDPGACGPSCTPCAPPTSGEGAPTCAVGASGSHECAVICWSGHHACGTFCGRDDDVATCGDRCTPCPSPLNGRATCGDRRCGITCDAGFHAEGDTCATNCTPADCGAGQFCGTDGRCGFCPSVDPGAGVETEPNDTAATGDSMDYRPGTSTNPATLRGQGTLCRAGDVDHFGAFFSRADPAARLTVFTFDPMTVRVRLYRTVGPVLVAELVCTSGMTCELPVDLPAAIGNLDGIDFEVSADAGGGGYTLTFAAIQQ